MYYLLKHLLNVNFEKNLKDSIKVLADFQKDLDEGWMALDVAKDNVKKPVQLALTNERTMMSR